MSQQIILFSYWPLYNPATHGHVAGDTIPASSMEAMLNTLYNDYDHPVQACVWANYPFRPSQGPITSVIPVLVMDKAHQIADHLSFWADGDLNGWFDLYYHWSPANTAPDTMRYSVTIMPRVTRSVHRYRLARLINHEEFIDPDTAYTILYRPLIFGTANSPLFPKIIDRLPAIGATSMVGFLDRKHLDKNNPGAVDDANIKVLGPFIRGDQNEPSIKAYLEEYLIDMKAPLTGHWQNPEAD